MASSSMFGIMFGGFMKGMEKDGRIIMLNPPLVFGTEKFILRGSKY
jgi:hypothetical protein